MSVVEAIQAEGGRGEASGHGTIVYRALSPRQPRHPPLGYRETWETRRPPPPAVSETEESPEAPPERSPAPVPRGAG